MSIINFKDLQYKKEKEFFSTLQPTYKKLVKDHPELKREFYIREDKFYHLISNAIQVDEHYIVKNITRQINRHLKTDFAIKVYVFQADQFQAFCTPRTIYDKKGKVAGQELIILVSQHFFNSLGEYERVSVIAHELAHMVYGHVHIPVEILMKKKFDLEYIESFKANLLKWALCREITADIFSLVASDFNHNIVNRSLIKFSTGLDNVYGDDMIRMALSQYDQIADAAYQEKVSTHPLMPLRIKIINEIINTKLVENYGRSVTALQKKKFITEFNKCIDNIVEKIYPEIISDNLFKGSEILFNMSVAVALSDGEISPNELTLINEVSKLKQNYKNTLKIIEETVNDKNYKQMVQKLVKRSIAQTKKSKYTKNELVPLIRHLILIAAADGSIDNDELETIISYAESFNFTRIDVIITISSLGL